MLFRPISRLLLLLLILPLFNGASCFLLYAQESKATTSDLLFQGIKFYKEGNTKYAVKILRSIVKDQKENIDAWFYLGLALAREGDIKGARQSYETTLKLKPNHVVARTGLAWTQMLTGNLDKAEREVRRALELAPQHTEAYFILGTIHLRSGNIPQAIENAERAIKLNPQYALPHLLKSQAIISAYAQEYDNYSGPAAAKHRREVFKQAADSLEAYLKLAKNDEDVDVWHEQLTNLKIYAGASDQTSDNPLAFSSREVITNAKILKKPKPSYTESARQAGITGSVFLLAVLAKDGAVKNILAVKPLPYGLTKACIEAARKIKFQPAIKDGRPVSQVVGIEYNFNLY